MMQKKYGLTNAENLSADPTAVSNDTPGRIIYLILQGKIAGLP
jgi:hypothetical protein